MVRLPEKIVGFLTYDLVDFHNEPAAFFPIMAHAAEASYKLNVYSMMYTYVSQKLVEQGCLNHLFTFFALDQALQAYLFELGFGLYVVDAYRGLQHIPIEGKEHDIVVRKAGLNDVDELLGLVQESARYYAEAPLFLKRDSKEKAGCGF